MADLRSQVKVGDNIYEATKKIEGRYHNTTGPVDSTKRDEKIWLYVDFGLQPNFVETVGYMTDTEIPFSGNKSICAVIQADSSGTITSIE